MISKKDEIRKKINKLKKEKLCIKIQKFLILYCGISERILKDKEIRHSDLSILLPNLKRVSFDEILYNIEAFYRGKFIIVVDSFGNIAPYVMPVNDEINLDDDYSEIDIDIYIEQKDEDIEVPVLDEDLSIFELTILCNYYKEHGEPSKYKKVRELLKKKKDKESVQKYKKRKLELRMKGREEYD